MRLFGERLEQRFVVATWDQRGAGKSRAALDPTETYTLDHIVADTIEVTEYLRQRFDEQKIYLVGNSWGTTLGVLAVQQRPDLYSAFVGTGQMVSETETDRMFLQDSLSYARSIGNAGLETTLLGLGRIAIPGRQSGHGGGRLRAEMERLARCSPRRVERQVVCRQTARCE